MDNEKDIKKENSAMEKVENAALTNEVAPPAKKNKTAVKKAQTSSDKQNSSDKRGKGAARTNAREESAAGLRRLYPSVARCWCLARF